MLRCLLLLLVLNAIHPVAFSQSTIYGTVRDADRLEPLEFASVFIDGTTEGTSTNEKGEFVITTKSTGRINLIVSYVGYQSASMWITMGNNDERLQVNLIQESKRLDEVAVNAERDKGREKFLIQFEKEFIGLYGSTCRIVNPQVIDVYNNEALELVATANVPIEVENSHLGYRVRFYLKDFVVGKDAFSISGNTHFQAMHAASKKEFIQWQRNRGEAYRGSWQHFIKSMAMGTLEKEGFKVYALLDGGELNKRSDYFYTRELNKTIREVTNDELVISEKSGLYRFKGTLEIHYIHSPTRKKRYTDVNHQVSWMQASGDTIHVNPHGQLNDPRSIWAFGDMGMRRISEMLPLDYQLSIDNETKSDRESEGDEGASMYVHLSKPYYYPGDTIWYKPHVLSASATQYPVSRVVYLDLISPNKKIVSSQKIKMADSLSGYFLLPASVTGNYFLRTYTSPSDSDGGMIQIPVLSIYQNVVPYEDDGELSEGVSLTSNKEIYGLRENVDLEIQYNGWVGNSSLSISVADSVMSLPWKGMNSIVSQPRSGEKSKINIGSNGLSFTGLVTRQKGDGDLYVHVIQTDLGYMNIVPVDDAGQFNITGLDFYDSMRFMVQVISRNKIVERKVNFQQTASLPMPSSMKETAVEIISVAEMRSDGSYKVGRETKVLEEVEIHAKSLRTIRSDVPTYSLSGKDLRPTGINSNVLMGLKGKVTGLTVRQYYDEMGMKKVEIRMLGGLNSFFYVEPLILVDSVATGGANSLLGLTSDMIDRIDIMTNKSAAYGARSAAGVISIITKMGPYASPGSVIERQNFKWINLKGFTKPSMFFSPDYLEKNETLYDYRSTLYWNPKIAVDGSGNSHLEFYTGDIEGTYRCVLEGVINSHPVRAVYYFKVKSGRAK